MIPNVRHDLGKAEAAVETSTLTTFSTPIDRLFCSPANPRHNEDAVTKVADSIRRFGWQQPIVARRSGEVIAGNTRLKAAQMLGHPEVPVVWFDGSDLEATAYQIADNRTHEFSEWDGPALVQLLEQLREEAELDGTGFSHDDIENLLAELADETDASDLDDPGPPPPPEFPVSRTGDLWILGDHRVLCGDSTSSDDVAQLLGDEKAHLCLTDPPYSVGYERSQKARGGNLKAHRAYKEGGDPRHILKFLNLIPADLLVMSYPVDRHLGDLVSALRSGKWEVRKELIWVKNSFSFWPGSVYQQRHEPILICSRSGQSIRGNVPSNESTVLEYDRPQRHDKHPTEKPLDLWSRLLSNHSDPRNLVYDPFLGSGTTLIACEKLRRTCRAIEISPAYVDVSIRRWQQATGGKAVLEATGETFCSRETT